MNYDLFTHSILRVLNVLFKRNASAEVVELCFEFLYFFIKEILLLRPLLQENILQIIYSIKIEIYSLYLYNNNIFIINIIINNKKRRPSYFIETT